MQLDTAGIRSYFVHVVVITVPGYNLVFLHSLHPKGQERARILQELLRHRSNWPNELFPLAIINIVLTREHAHKHKSTK